MTQGLKNTIKILVAFFLVLGLCALAVLLVVNPKNMFHFSKEESSTVSDGEAYIKTMEAAPTAPIEDMIYTKRREEILDQFRQDPERVWTFINESNLIFCGDSRGIGFTVEGYVDYNHNVSNYSRTIYNIPDYYDTLKERNPHYIVICYGINDLGLYQWEGKEKYTEDLANFVYTLRELIPGVDVYVNSIPPSLPSEYERGPAWALIPEWNEYIRNYCSEHDIHYVDISDLCNAHPELYDVDGVHFFSEFYPMWGMRVVTTIIENEN